MKLCYSTGVRSLAVHVALHEVGTQLDLITVDPTKYLTTDGTDFYTISPRGHVLLLELADDSRHTEGATPLQYVAGLDPAQALIGKSGSARRLAVIEWLAFVSTELHKGFGPSWCKDTPETARQGTKDKLAKHFAELDVRLARQSYLTDTYSMADAYASTVLNWVNILVLPMDAYPNVQVYTARMATWPHAIEALTAESLIEASGANEASVIA